MFVHIRYQVVCFSFAFFSGGFGLILPVHAFRLRNQARHTLRCSLDELKGLYGTTKAEEIFTEAQEILRVGFLRTLGIGILLLAIASSLLYLAWL